jgi:hypothetical protein
MAGSPSALVAQPPAHLPDAGQLVSLHTSDRSICKVLTGYNF